MKIIRKRIKESRKRAKEQKNQGTKEQKNKRTKEYKQLNAEAQEIF